MGTGLQDGLFSAPPGKGMSRGGGTGERGKQTGPEKQLGTGLHRELPAPSCETECSLLPAKRSARSVTEGVRFVARKKQQGS